jgi:hypothetical protein
VFTPDALLLALVLLTWVAGYLVGTRRWGLARPELGGALRALLETVGTSAVFLVANLGLAVGVVFMIRAGSGHFVSLYAIDDIALAGASLLQGFLFRWWWGRRY